MAGTVDSTGRGHPISLGVSRIADELKTLRDQPAWSMTAAETRAVLVEATRLVARRRPETPGQRGRARPSTGPAVGAPAG